jgi:hypothetical protein
MGYDAVRALSNNKSRGHKPAVRKEKHTEKNKEKPTSQKNDMPPKVVDASSATASSISVLEYSMPFNYDGKKMTFQTCVKDHLFPLVKFLPQGDDDTNLEYSLDAMTVCGFLRQHCGVLELDAPNWWKEQKKHLRRTLTDFRNNRIKEMQKRFLGTYTNSLNTSHVLLHGNRFVVSNTTVTIAWMDEDSNACEVINTAISRKRQAQEQYIQLIRRFAPAVKRVDQWNKIRHLSVTESLTVSDKAFVILCLISYGARWITMHKNKLAKQEDSDAPQESLPVSIHLMFLISHWKILLYSSLCCTS